MNNSNHWVTQRCSQVKVKKISSFPWFSQFIFFFPSCWDNFSSKPKDIYLSVILQCVQINRTTKSHMSVTQEKIKSVGFPVAIQSVRIPSKFMTMTGKKGDDQAQSGYSKGNIFICGRQFYLSFLFMIHKERCICTKICGHFKAIN